MDPALAATEAGDDPAAESDSPLPKGAVLGRYVVISPLGQGAMGVVYKAYDPELDRSVALKVLRRVRAPGSEAQARLVREGQAMARLAHPNVVTVHDVGVHRGQVFIAMELVEGETLRDWLEKPRPWREVVSTFVQVGRGLSAAHAAGIVHRDFKPDNAVLGADGRPRVVDFGLAHAPRETPSAAAAAAAALGDLDGLDDGLAVTLGTSAAVVGSVVGTPRYMAAEQLMGERVTAAADQFAFCASLWEALYGQPPFEGDEILTLISNVREQRIIEPPPRGVPGWLRPLLLRGLSVDAEKRYASMDALLAALEHDPAVVRRRWLAGAAAAAVAVGAVALGAHRLKAPPPLCPSAAPQLEAVWGDARKERLAAAFHATGKPFADDAIRGTSAALDAYGAAWVTMHGDACEASRVRGEQSSELLDLRMDCLGRHLDALRALVDQLVVADATAVEGALQGVEALPPISDCADVAALRAPASAPSDPALRARIAGVRDEIARAFALQQTSRYDDAKTALRDAVAAAHAIAYAPLEAEALDAQGSLFLASQEPEGASTALEDAVLSAIAGREEAVESHASTELVRAYAISRRWDRAHEAARRAEATLARDPDDLRTATLLRNEGFTSWREGKLMEARATLERALALYEKALPPDHPDIALVLLYLGNTLLNQGLYDEGLAATRRALRVREQAFGPAHPSLASPLQTIGNALMMLGDDAGSEASYQRAFDLRVAAFGMENGGTVEALEGIGNARLREGDLAGALDVERQALSLSERVYEQGSDELASKLVNLADVLLAMKRWDEALPYEERALSIAEASYGKTAWLVAYPLEGMGRLWLGKGEPQKALPLVERALTAIASPDADPQLAAETRATAALVLRATHGDLSRATSLAAQARAVFEKEPRANGAHLQALDAAFPKAAAP